MRLAFLGAQYEQRQHLQLILWNLVSRDPGARPLTENRPQCLPRPSSLLRLVAIWSREVRVSRLGTSVAQKRQRNLALPGQV